MFLRFSKYNIIFIVQCISLTLLHGLDSTHGNIINDPLKVRLTLFVEDTSSLDTPDTGELLPSLTIDLDNKGDYNPDNPEPESYSTEKLKRNQVALYYFPTSSVCRAVIILGYMLKIRFDYRPVEIYRKEHNTDWYKKMNPDQVVPTIIIDEENTRSFQSESHEIIIYLWKKFGANYVDELYPKKMQDKIDEMMELDKSLFEYFKKQYFSWIWENEDYNKEHETKIHEILNELENKLKYTKFAACDTFTLADISLYATVTTYKALLINFDDYPKINNWLNVCKNGEKDQEEKVKKYIPTEFNDSELMTFLEELVQFQKFRNEHKYKLKEGLEKYDKESKKHQET